MRCSSCGMTIYPGEAKCASCGTPAPSLASEFSSYLSSDDPIPYIPYSAPTETTQAPLTSEQKSTAQTLLDSSTKDTSTLVTQQQQAQKRPSQRQLHPAFTGLLLLAITTQANATATTTANSPQNIYNLTTGKNPSFTDPLDGQHSGLWGKYSNGSSSCAFANGAYHIQISAQETYYTCLSTGGDFTNYVFQVQFKIIKGSEAGIIFRSTNSIFASYTYTINYTGLYTLGIVFNSQQGTVLAFGRSPAIKTGLNQLNLISVLLRGDEIDLFINKQFVTSVHDQTHPSGAIGLIADNTTHISTDSAFSNAQFWNLP
jgi:3-keto-disaccharide hydrolase